MIPVNNNGRLLLLVETPSNSQVRTSRAATTVVAISEGADEVTIENLCRVHTKRQVKIKIKMYKFNLLITAVCVLFLIKLRWPKNKVFK